MRNNPKSQFTKTVPALLTVSVTAPVAPATASAVPAAAPVALATESTAWETTLVAPDTASAADFIIESYHEFAPPKNPVNIGFVNQPSIIFITASNTHTAPNHTRNGTNKKLGVRFEKCPPKKLLLFLIVNISCFK